MLKSKQASRAGTRCVSTLSSDQLIRKRANDREAQRAIRKRAKDHIEDLERRIQELTRADGGNAAALVDARERNRELEEEMIELREKFMHMESSPQSYGEWPSDVENGGALSSIPVFKGSDHFNSGSSNAHGENYHPEPRLSAPAVTNGLPNEQLYKLEARSTGHANGSYCVDLPLRMSSYLIFMPDR